MIFGKSRRMNHPKFLALLFVGLCSISAQTPISGNQDFCTNLKAIVEASKENFESLKGERKKGAIDLFYTSKVNLPGSTDSKLVLGEVAWTYSAKMFEGKDKAAAEADYQSEIKKIQQCLGANWGLKSSELPGKLKKTVFTEKSNEGCGTTVHVQEGESPIKPGYYKVSILVQIN